MKSGKCKLCLTENIKLLSKSHIIPSFFHYGLKDSNERYNVIKPDKYIEGRNQHWQKPSGAMYEENILCEKCDNEIIGSLESYLSKALIENEKNLTEQDFYTDFKNIQFKIYKEIDYTKFKLGLLSILWRSSISSKDFFKVVNIADNNAEDLRLMILNSDAKSIEEYPIITFLINEKDEKNIIINPRFLNENGNQYCKIIINGYMFLFIIGKIDNPENLELYIPNKSGNIYMEIKGENYLKKYTENIMLTTKEKLKIK